MKHLLRIAMIVIWTVAAFSGWLLSVNLAPDRVPWPQDRYRWPFYASLNGNWPELIIGYGMLGVGVLITTGVLLLGMRGKLPGTRKTRPEKLRGFAVEPLSAQMRADTGTPH